MSLLEKLPNRVKKFREERGLSQMEVSTRAGISRAAVSAIEGQRLVPSVATALALANVFGCAVEELFGDSHSHLDHPRWAWAPPAPTWRYCQAEVQGLLYNFPVERTSEMNFPHDGVLTRETDGLPLPDARRTLVVAGCDPASGFLATEYERRTGFRLLVFMRSSQSSLELLQQGLVHVAGIHYSTREQREANARLVRERLGDGYTLARGAGWQAGLAVSPTVHEKTVDAVIKSRPRWVGRETGSAARRCLDQLLASTKTNLQHIATDHRSVAQAIRSGWADTGVCVKLVSDELGLRFLPIQTETYDLCFPTKSGKDPRIMALLSLLQSQSYRRLIGDLPGYETGEMGEVQVLRSSNST